MQKPPVLSNTGHYIGIKKDSAEIHGVLRLPNTLSLREALQSAANGKSLMGRIPIRLKQYGIYARRSYNAL